MQSIRKHPRVPIMVALPWLAMSCASVTRMDSVSCCVQSHPGNPEMCGLSAAEAAVLMGA